MRNHLEAISKSSKDIRDNAPLLAAKLDECKDDSAAAVSELLYKAKGIAVLEQARFAAKIK